MKYPEETMKFWKTMYRLFHGKALQFMSGEKSSGQVISNETEKGNYCPSKTTINFAVPNTNAVRNYESPGIVIPKEIKPGVILQGIELRSKDKDYVLSVDGKKLAPGLGKDLGDQDLFGHEEYKTLSMTNSRLNTEVQLVNDTCAAWNGMSRETRHKQLKNIVRIVSVRIQNMRQLFVKENLALQKFRKEAGEQWRESKFVYAISSIQAQIFQIKAVVKKLLDANDGLLRAFCLSQPQEQQVNVYTSQNSIDLSAQENCVLLKDQSDIPVELCDDLRHLKQRSDKWFDIRKQYKVTGSTLFAALGLDGLNRQQAHFDKSVRGIDSSDSVSDEVQKRLQHGTSSEIHAVATLVSKVLPFFYPDLKYVEEGAYTLSGNSDPLLLISPDGSLCNVEVNSADVPVPVYGCEFKCPVPADYKTPVHYEIPLRATFDFELWDLIQDEAGKLYTGTTLKRSTKRSLSCKLIEEKLRSYRESSIEFLCELPSVRGCNTGTSQTSSGSPYLFPIVTLGNTQECTDISLIMIMDAAVSAIQEAHQIQRKRATEVLVWLLSDTDRIWDPEIPHSSPVGYAMKGYSLPVRPMRDMHEHILSACHEKDLNVVCSCFDGQWLKLATRTVHNKPLTLLQLQRDVFEEAQKIDRKKIINDLRSNPVMNSTQLDLCHMRVEGVFVVSCLMLEKVMNAIKFSKNENQSGVERPQSELLTDIMSCLPDKAPETLILEEQSIEDRTNFDNTLNNSDAPFVTDTESVSVSTDTTSECVNTKNISETDLAAALLMLQLCKGKAAAQRWQGKSTFHLKECIKSISSTSKV